MLIKCTLALLLVSVLGEVVGTDNVDVHESHPEKPASQKGRLSLQNTGKRINASVVKLWSQPEVSLVCAGTCELRAVRNRPMHILSLAALRVPITQEDEISSIPSTRREIQYLRKLLIAWHKVCKDIRWHVRFAWRVCLIFERTVD